MSKKTAEEIKSKMMQALALLKEAVDLSIPLLGTKEKAGIVGLWEAFLKDFIAYVRLRAKATGVNLMGKISLRRILLG